MDKDKLVACLNLVRRLPASRLRQNVSALANLRPELQDELLQRVEQPLEVLIDEKNGQEFLKSEYNRDGDSYRSPFTNEYYPSIDTPLLPSPQLRELELKAMSLFREYTHLYYDGAILSTYFWDKEENGFAGCVLIKKEVEKTKALKKGNWDSINVIDVIIDKSKSKITYRVTCTAMLNFVMDDENCGDLTLAGNFTKQREETESYKDLKDVTDEFHLSNIGRLVEETETQVRNYLEQVYFGKTKEIALSTRYEDDGKASMKGQKKFGVSLPGMQKASN